jgi:signal peptidase I
MNNIADKVNETNYYRATDENVQKTLQNVLQFHQARKTEAGKLTDNKETSPQPSVLKDLLFLLIKIACIVLVFALLFTFMFGLVRYEDPSMDPAIKDGDLVILYRYTKSGYSPQDLVALDYNGKKQIRRVIATAGDEVDITEDGLVINGALQQEPDIYQKTDRYEDGVSFPLTVPEGQIFVLGDNRTDSIDSRIYGCVQIENTIGKVMTVIRRRSI